MNKKLINLFFLMEDYFFGMISKQVLKFNHNVNAYLTGVQSENLNFLALRETPKDIDEILNSAHTFFKKGNCPWIIVIPEIIFSTKIEQTFFERSFEIQEKTQAMFYDLETFNFLDNSQHEIINMNDNLHDWSLPFDEAFQSDRSTSKQYMQTHEHAKNKNANFQHFSIYSMNKPISSITVSIENSVARIDDLGTVPAFQNKGYATLLIKHCLSFSKAKGASICFLESSKAGMRLYEKLGFKPLFTNLLFHQKEDTKYS